MKELLPKFRELEKELSKEKGEFNLFALFLREDAADKWDFVLSAPWITANKESALAYVVEKLHGKIATRDLVSLSRIVFMEKDNPFLDAFYQAIDAQHANIEIVEGNLFGLHIRHAFIITSQRLIPKTAAKKTTKKRSSKQSPNRQSGR